MKILITVLLVSIALPCWAQSYSIAIDSEDVLATLEMTTSVEAIQSNLINSNLDLRMELLDVSAPPEWDIFLCTPTFCAAPGETDILYGLDSGQAAQVKVSFSPGSAHGSATAKWVISDVNDTLSTDTFNISASTLVGVKDPSRFRSIVISKTLNGIQITGELNRVEVISMTGKIMLQESGVSGTTLINTNFLSTGIFLIRLYSNGSILTQKILL